MRRVACIALPDIRSEIGRETELLGALERVAEMVLSFGPVVSFCEKKVLVWVEVGGCAHLFGDEEGLVSAMGERLRESGHTHRIALADGPAVAEAVVRFSTEHRIVPREKGAAAMSALPVAALALGDDLTTWLENLGLKTCGELQKLPRSALGLRLGKQAHDVFGLLDGVDNAPLDAFNPPLVPEERIDLEWGASSVEALAFVIKALCDRLASRLESRRSGAARLEIVLGLDRALCAREREGDGSLAIELTLPAPIEKSCDLFAVVRARLARETLSAPALSVTLRAPELALVSARALSLFVPEPKADRSLPRLVSELAAELGESSIGILALVDTWIPDDRSKLAPFGSPRPEPRNELTVPALEPSRLVVPTVVPRSVLAEIDLVGRIETAQWWQRGDFRCDIVTAWIEHDCAPFDRSISRSVLGGHLAGHPSGGLGEVGALAWIQFSNKTSAVLHGWID